MTPNAWVIVAQATEHERVVALSGRLLVGRECAGVEPSRCLILDDPAVSRDHVELRSEPGRGSVLIDTSTNGTWLNGRRVERGEPIPLADGDRIELGTHELIFHVIGADQLGPDETGRTRVDVEVRPTAIVAGDIVGYTTLTEVHGAREVAGLTGQLFDALRRLLSEHGGTVVNYVGDAILAAWDLGRDPGAASRAVAFALAADALVEAREPLRMGWAVTLGEAAVGRPSATHQTVHGDAVNLAFRLASLAGRDGRAPVLVAADAVTAAPSAARYGEAEELRVKGRVAPAHVAPARR